MKDNRIELADVVRQFKDDYLAQFGHLMMPSQKKALADIAACMTAEMGGHQYRCCDCDHTFWVYHGCRNRACPAGHGRRMRDWLQARQTAVNRDLDSTDGQSGTTRAHPGQSRPYAAPSNRLLASAPRRKKPYLLGKPAV